MIVYSDLLFTIPPSFIRQIRLATVFAQRTESFKIAKKEKRIRRLDPRRIKPSKTKADATLQLPDSETKFFQQSFPPDSSSLVIRVRLGKRYSVETDQQHQHKVSTAIQVTPALTAGDVVSKFCSTGGAQTTSYSLCSSSLTSSPEVSASSDVSCSDKSSSSSHEDLLTIDGVAKGCQTLDVRDSRRESEPDVSLETHFLVEQGGNIGTYYICTVVRK